MKLILGALAMIVCTLLFKEFKMFTIPDLPLQPAPASPLASTSTPQTAPQPSLKMRAVNSLLPVIHYRHHPVFEYFEPWTGTQEAGRIHTFLGTTFGRDYFCNNAYMTQPIAHAQRFYACNAVHWTIGQAIYPAFPVISEEYWEYTDVLQTVVNYPNTSTRPYTFVEVGAGYGHWTYEAISAFRQYHKSENFFGELVEGTPAKLPIIDQHRALNNIPSSKIQVTSLAVVADVNEQPSVKFPAHASDYGAHIGAGDIIVNTTTLATLLAPYQIVDMLDVDIQGAEVNIFNPFMSVLTQKVKHVHIGTHGAAGQQNEFGQRVNPLGNAVERIIYDLFTGAGWEARVIQPRTSWECKTSEHFAYTELGPVCFADGAMSFVNPRLKGK